MANTRLSYHKNAERPAAKLWLFDDDGTLIDFSSGYTFSFKIGVVGSAAVLTKTSNITGAAGSGTEPTGTPNVTITWTAGELALTPKVYTWQLVCSTGGVDRTFEGELEIRDVIT